MKLGTAGPDSRAGWLGQRAGVHVENVSHTWEPRTEGRSRACLGPVYLLGRGRAPFCGGAWRGPCRDPDGGCEGDRAIQAAGTVLR